MSIPHKQVCEIGMPDHPMSEPGPLSPTIAVRISRVRRPPENPIRLPDWSGNKNIEVKTEILNSPQECRTF